MKNANTPAMPGEAEVSNKGESRAFQIGTNSKFKFPGLTKREMFAMNIMSAYRSQPETMEAKPAQVAEWAIEDADALLKELEK
ncbi:coil containing protein [Vibrio phage 1.060.A._10N.261.48.B5]|nr:coil containing protein [Vibrio phage 1.060.A._10N.261.48.B5]